MWHRGFVVARSSPARAGGVGLVGAGKDKPGDAVVALKSRVAGVRAKE
ncbi:TPA: hypothetical protein N2E47_002183 [Salmonella enterica]|nr:hypothetical protein [Salmonella enterica]